MARLLSFPGTRRQRELALQAVFLSALAALVLGAALTARERLAAQGLTSGFGFLRKATGWEINFALLPTTTADPYWWYLLSGLVNTLFMGAVGLSGAFALGLLVGLMRSGRNPAARLLGTLYVELFRNLPIILQLFFWYAVATALPNPRQSIEIGGALVNARGIYLPGPEIGRGIAALSALAILAGAGLAVGILAARRFRRAAPLRRQSLAALSLAAGFAVAAGLALAFRDPATPWITHPRAEGLRITGGWRIQPEFYALALTIITYGAAYVGEIVRGGLKAVPRGQIEAAAALGLTAWQRFSRVTMPLAFRAMLPMLANQSVWLMKATTLGIAVGFSDFFMVVAGSINHSGQTLELIGILMAGFLAINLTLAALMNRLDRALSLEGSSMRPRR